MRIPARLVEQALATAPRRVTLYNRDGQPVMPVEGCHTFFGPGSDCLNIVDHRTGQRRQPMLQDVVEGITVCDALEHIDFVMSMFLPSDVNQEIADRYQMEVMLNHTTKPIVFVTYALSGCVDAIEMAEAVAAARRPCAKNPAWPVTSMRRPGCTTTRRRCKSCFTWRQRSAGDVHPWRHGRSDRAGDSGREAQR